MSNQTDVAKASESKEVAKKPRFQVLDLKNLDKMPDLSKAEEIPVDLTVQYWTPEKAGENKRLIFTGINVRETIDEESGEISTLPCAFFLEQDDDGDTQTVCNGSKRLVGAFEGDKIKPGTPVSITYVGKVKNKTNAYQSDTWRVRPLVIDM